MKGHIGIGAIAAAIVLGTVIAHAAPFAQEFTLGECVGTCEIAPPGSATFSPAEKGKKCLYGTTLKTGRKSSITVQLSDGNEFRLLADALAVATEDQKDKSFKVVNLKIGKVDVKLDPSFHKTNKFRVETATAVCGAIGCEFSVDAQAAENAQTVVVLCADGDIQLSGTGTPGWTTAMNKGDGVTFTTDGKGFMSIKGTGGSFQMVFTSTSGEKFTVDVPAGTTITSATEKLTDANGNPVIKVTLTITTPDGKSRVVTFLVTPAGIPMADIRSITSAFTTGTTPTQVGAGIGN